MMVLLPEPETPVMAMLTAGVNSKSSNRAASRGETCKTLELLPKVGSISTITDGDEIR
jgi:hypothetical protein